MVLKLAKITQRHDPAALFLTAGTGNAQQWEKGYDESSKERELSVPSWAVSKTTL